MTRVAEAGLIGQYPDKPVRTAQLPIISETVTWLGHAVQGRIYVAEPWLSADDIAAHLGITKDTVYSWIAERAMPAHKVGRLWKFQASEIDDWVRRGGATGEDV